MPQPGGSYPPPRRPPAGYAPAPPPRQGGGGGGARPSRPARPFRWGRRLRALLVVLALLVLGSGIYVDTQLTRVAALADYTGRPDTGGTNWLIVGSDSRANLTEQQEATLSTGNAAGQRTDTVMLLHTGSSGTTLVSLPRDRWSASRATPC